MISDASDDGTDEIVRSFVGQNVSIRRLEPRGGKSKGLTTFVPEVNGEIVVFSDANSMYDYQAIRNLVRNFADPDVGYVVGHQRYARDEKSAVAQSEGTYWSLEVKLKYWEGRLSSVVGGDGAIYAIRKELFTPLADEDISDFVNPLQIVVANYCGVFEPEAYCLEEAASSFEGEFRRKVRIVNRALRGLAKVRTVLNPFRVGWFAYQIILHKLLRWFTPFFLLLTLVGSTAAAILGAGPFYQAVVWLQCGCYGLAALKVVPGLRDTKPVYFAYYFVLSSVAAFLGTISILRGQRFQVWRPERT